MKTAMKRFAFVIISASLPSCGDVVNEAEQKSDSAAVSEALEAAGEVNTHEIDSLCYLLAGGTTKQDTKSLKLVMQGDEVTGVLMYLPHQKDARFGRIRGSRDGDIMFGTWYYEQEGMKDSVGVSFKRDGSDILQQPSSFNEKTGKEYLNTSAPYSIRYSRTDCSNLPQYNIDF
ncbi:MAG: hypothetical protein K0R82_2064 [Flavipsychrobacter sp.]|jgi:hypothetical protein|nr:hypothetical protein [Flavipsychrobacter sp.]